MLLLELYFQDQSRLLAFESILFHNKHRLTHWIGQVVQCLAIQQASVVPCGDSLVIVSTKARSIKVACLDQCV